MYPENLPEKLVNLTKVKVRCDDCGQERVMDWGNANRNLQKHGRHYLRCCSTKGPLNPACRPEVRAQMKQTIEERYGGVLPMNSPEQIKAKADRLKDKEFKDTVTAKRRKTNVERYGVDHPMKNEEVKERQQGSLMESYGVKVPLQSPEILARMRQKVLDRHGVENVAQLPEVRVKMAQTTMDRYGVEHYNQLPEMRDYLRENCTNWLAGSYASGGPNKGIVRPEEWNQKQRETVAALIADGTWLGGGKHSKKGRYIRPKKCRKEEPMFRSSFEQIVHLHLDTSAEVEWYDYEPFSIPYLDSQNDWRSYTPDFLVKYYGRHTLVILEVKNAFHAKSDITARKGVSAMNYGEVNGMRYELWDDIVVESLGIDLRLHEDCFVYFHQPNKNPQEEGPGDH